MEQAKSIFDERLKDIRLEVKHILEQNTISARELDLNQTLLSILDELNFDNKDSMRSGLAHFIVDSYDNLDIGEKVLKLIAKSKAFEKK
ncbi:hypothetical protein [Hymenobacter sp. GOD-10R]|uniref:hypothetical protein n=1 Tax=Hymenobacter sp. GOD-10R TaxID=3093922 RepID=UPI002D797F0B|nr:hypothetical protein [Hymenobacter sp. GOD-10R]WRQ30956.1 hypothetical protein SD425_11865 [Hymenobacter sp. GOD-10R]